MTENESKEWEIKDPNAPDNTPQEKQPEVKNEPPKSVQDSIANVVQQYSSFQDQINNTSFNKKKSKEKGPKTKKRGGFATFIVSVLTLIFLFVVLCIGLTYIALPEMDKEANDITDKLDEAETAFYTTFNTFLFVQPTNYDKNLNVDISTSKYFTAYEVVPKQSDDKETEKCEIKLYGANGIFSIAFCYLKASIDSFLGDESAPLE